jgi:hypothetical protein
MMVSPPVLLPLRLREVRDIKRLECLHELAKDGAGEVEIELIEVFRLSWLRHCAAMFESTATPSILCPAGACGAVLVPSSE